MRIILSIFLVSICAVSKLNSQFLTPDLANKIAHRIWNANGMKGECPKVIFEKNERLGKWMAYPDNLIGICPDRVIKPLDDLLNDEDAEAALAIIIGHELNHSQNGVSRFFGFLGDDEEGKYIELDADYQGLIFAYFSGYYNAVDIYGKLFTIIKMPHGEGYPTVDERINVNKEVTENAQRLIQIFECGSILLTSATEPKDYLYARLCYQYVRSQLVATPEISYNIGLSFFSEALMMRKADPFVFPLECSDFLALNRLSGVKFTEGNYLLDSASYYFTKARHQTELLQKTEKISTDWFYAELGLCAVATIKNPDEGLNLLNKLDAGILLTPDFQMLKGITLALKYHKFLNSKDSLDSERVFQQLLGSSNANISKLAKVNLNVLRRVSQPIDSQNKLCAALDKKIDGVSNLSDAVALNKDRQNTGIEIGANRVFYSYQQGSIYLFEVWEDGGSNPTQTVIQKVNEYNCVNSSDMKWNALLGKYFGYIDDKTHTALVLHKDADIQGGVKIYRVFR